MSCCYTLKIVFVFPLSFLNVKSVLGGFGETYYWETYSSLVNHNHNNHNNKDNNDNNQNNNNKEYKNKNSIKSTLIGCDTIEINLVFVVLFHFTTFSVGGWLYLLKKKTPN